MDESELIRRAQKLIRRYDDMKIVGSRGEWSGSARLGFAFNPVRGGGGEGGVSPPVTGACCIGSDCSVTTRAICEGSGGTYQGDNTDCDPNPCPSTTTGACCASDGTCSVLTEQECIDSGGDYQGDGTDCDPNPCPSSCCTDGVITLPLLNLQYEVSVTGTADPGCQVYTLDGTSGEQNIDLSSPPGNQCSGIPPNRYSGGTLNETFSFNTSPPGTISPNCVAQFSIFLNCGSNAWTLEGVITSGASSGGCEGLCGGETLLDWGGADTGVTSLGVDPRGIYSFDVTDLIYPGLTWHFVITIT